MNKKRHAPEWGASYVMAQLVPRHWCCLRRPRILISIYDLGNVPEKFVSVGVTEITHVAKNALEIQKVHFPRSSGEGGAISLKKLFQS
jgi:hypothetical protein